MPTTPDRNGFRQEKDSIGIKEIPADVYYGVQTARAVENYPISGMRANPTLIRAIGMVKYAAAQANKELGLVDDKRADAIMQAAQRSCRRQVGRVIRRRRLSGRRRRELPHELQ